VVQSQLLMERVGEQEAGDEAVKSLYVDMKLGGKTVKAGTYTLYAIPGKNNYTIIINKDLNVWGSYFIKEANDVARVSVPVITTLILLKHYLWFYSSDNGVVLNMG
jgi:hypothetical protein